MFDALVFSTVNALEFNEVRQDVIRIPEVIGRVREAQEIWDSRAEASLDLVNFIGSDDRSFLSNLRLKNLATTVIQLGLLDRFRKHHELPQYILGLSNGDSALKVASGQMTFTELMQSSAAVGGVKPGPVAGFGNLPLLSGIALAEFSLLKMVEGEARAMVRGEMDLKRLMMTLAGTPDVKKVVVIGPGATHVQTLFRDLPGKMDVVDSVALDPILSWFWNRKAEAAPEVLARVQ